MEIEILLLKMKTAYHSIIEFIETTETTKIDSLIKVFEEQEIIQNKEEKIVVLHILSKIVDNHCRMPDFINKLEQIFQYLIRTIQISISDFDFYQIYRNNKRVLLLLLEKKFILPDQKIISNIKQKKIPTIFYTFTICTQDSSHFLKKAKAKKLKLTSIQNIM